MYQDRSHIGKAETLKIVSITLTLIQMKKRNLKSLRINKTKVSVLNNKRSIKGGFWDTGWFCHSDMSECLCSGFQSCQGHHAQCSPLQTDEGPCPSGSAGCQSDLP